MKLTPTGIKAVDGEREIYLDEEGIGWDLPPDWSPKGFKLVGPAKSDSRRVLVEDKQGICWDVSPETAYKPVDP